MSFHDTRFPPNISYGSVGGPGFSNQIISTNSGHEEITPLWSQPRHKYDVSYGIRKHEDLSEVKTFFMARQGSAHSFRFKDWGDFKSTASGLSESMGGTQITYEDVLIGVGDGETTAFQLVKKYINGGSTRTRTISKPVNGTLVIAFDGAAQVSGWVCDYTTGIVTFSVAPTDSVQVTAGFEFDVHARFDSADETLMISLDSIGSGSTTIEIIEVVSPTPLSDSQYFGGSTSGTLFLEADTTLSETSGKLQKLDPGLSNKNVILPIPDVRLWPGGGPYWVIQNGGSVSSLVIKSGTEEMKSLAPGKAASVFLEISSDSYSWVVVG